MKSNQVDDKLLESKDFVLRLNELYHDIEGQQFEQKHPEIFEEGFQRWISYSEEFLSNKHKPLKVLDVGSGTGFVARTIGPFLKEQDELTCSDISIGMLNACRENVLAADLDCKTDFVKLSGDGDFPFADVSFDIVTFDASLHHIPDLQTLFSEVDRILSPGGQIVIGHESNRLYFEHGTLRLVYFVVSLLFNLKGSIYDLFNRLGVLESVKGTLSSLGLVDNSEKDLYNEINNRLISEGLVNRPLTSVEISRVIDIHSPTSGATVNSTKGFVIKELLRDYLDGYEVAFSTTYNHLDKLSYKNSFLRWVDGKLSCQFPEHGGSFLVVYRKRQA